MPLDGRRLEWRRPSRVAQERDVPDAAPDQIEQDAVGGGVVADLADQLDGSTRACGDQRHP
jgi:hypothetical protein